MTAYVIGNITVKDSDKWAEYRSLKPLRTQAADVDLVTFEGD